MFTTPMIIATASQASMPLVFNALIGTKFKIIPGYQGSAEAQLAMQRGEVMALPNGRGRTSGIRNFIFRTRSTF